MNAIDLTKKLQKYKTGWIALNSKNVIIAHADTFAKITDKIKNKKKEVVVMPASDNYFGYVTVNG